MDPPQRGMDPPQRGMDPLSKGQSMLTQRGMDLLTDLEKDVQHLKECMETLHDTVHSQQDTFDSIEDVIHSSQQNTIESQHAIVVASDYQSNYRNYILTAVTGILTALFFLL